MNHIAQKPLAVAARLEVAEGCPEEPRARREDSHPTRREDRPPNPREAARALSRDLGMPEDALDGLLELPPQ